MWSRTTNCCLPCPPYSYRILVGACLLDLAVMCREPPEAVSAATTGSPVCTVALVRKAVDGVRYGLIRKRLGTVAKTSEYFTGAQVQP